MILKKAYNSDEKNMSIDSFSKYLSKIPKDVDIHFSGYAEPWLNPNATKMLKLSLLDKHKVSIYTTLYGMSIDDAIEVIELSQKYVDQIKRIELHLPDKNNNMRGFKLTDTYLKVLDLFINFKDKNIIKDFNIMTMDSSNQFHIGIANKLKANMATNFDPVSRGGNLDNVKDINVSSPSHDVAIYCGFSPDYSKNVLMPNGDVSLCCQDYGLKHVIGNLNNDEYFDLFKSKELNEIRIENMQNRYSDKTLCRNCECAVPTSKFLNINRF
jgi:radical SAM protein with 4Fe4S-binding SPASM domain